MTTQNEIMQEILNNIDPEAIRIFGTQSVKDWIEDYVINLKKPISMDDLSDYVADVHSICSEASSY